MSLGSGPEPSAPTSTMSWRISEQTGTTFFSISTERPPNLGYAPMSRGTYPVGSYRPLPGANSTVPAPVMGQNYRGPNGFLP